MLSINVATSENSLILPYLPVGIVSLEALIICSSDLPVLFAAAASLKGMENNIQSTIEYTRERETFGKPILKNQVVQFRLAELQTEIEALRALVYDAVEGYIHGKDVLTKASMAKLKSGRLSREVSDSCLQYWGGMGFMWETGITRAYRDSRLGSIGGGSDEVMLGIISKQMGILD